MSKYNKTPNPKTQTLTIRLEEKQKNALQRIAYNENKTITRVILEAVKGKEKKFPV